MPIIIRTPEGNRTTFDAMRYIYKEIGGDPVDFNAKTGEVKVKFNDGEVRVYNLKIILAGLGNDIVSMDSLNTPEDAINVSPMTAKDRAKLSFSVDPDRPWAIKKMRKDISDAKMIENGSLVVNHKGIYKRVDPQGFDPNDFADMVGYVLPAAGYTAGVVGTAIATKNPLKMHGGGVVGGTGMEVVRQQIGAKMGAKKAGVYVPDVVAEAVSDAVVVPLVNKGLKVGAGFIKDAILPAVLKESAGIPEEVTAYVIRHPEVLKMKEAKLPNGRIYKMSKGVVTKLNKVMSITGGAVEDAVATSPSVRQTDFNYNDVRSIPQVMREDYIRKKWGGVNHLTANEEKILADLDKQVSEKTGQYGNKLTFEKVHNLKKFLQGRVEYEKRGVIGAKPQSKGESLIADIADAYNKMLRDASEDYKIANDTYAAYVTQLKGLPKSQEQAGKLYAPMRRLAMGKASPFDRETVAQAEETVGVPLTEQLEKMGKKYGIQNEAIKQFKKGTNLAGVAKLLTGTTLMSGGGQQLAAGRTPSNLPLLVALSAFLSSPRAVGGTLLAGQQVGKVLEKPIKYGLPQIMTKTGIDVLNKQLRLNRE